MGHRRNAQPYLANCLLTDQILDPEYFVIRTAILSARDYLFHSPPEEVHVFLQTVSQQHRSPGQIVGPAQALIFYLSKLAWRVTATGQLQTHELFDQRLFGVAS